MKQIIVLVAPPGAGKSTLAKSYELEGYVRVSQDDAGKKGHMDIFEAALLENKNIIIDRMGFSTFQRERYLVPAKEVGYTTKIIVLHESYDTCLERCLKREGHPTIKDEKNARSALHTFFSKYDKVKDAEASEVVRIWPSGEKSTAIIIDLDGTLCNIDHRLNFVKTDGKKNWKGFFEGIADDKVNGWCKELIQLLCEKHAIVLCSGRPDDHKKVTERWLKENEINYRYLFMRQRGDFRPDTEIKQNILDFEIKTRYTPYLSIDDRATVVSMWRSNGITCLACDEGNF